MLKSNGKQVYINGTTERLVIELIILLHNLEDTTINVKKLCRDYSVGNIQVKELKNDGVKIIM